MDNFFASVLDILIHKTEQINVIISLLAGKMLFFHS